MKDERRRVVITGTGLVTPLGTGVEKNWTALCEGHSGVGPITRFDVSDFPARIGGEVKDFEPQEFIEKKEIRVRQMQQLEKQRSGLMEKIARLRQRCHGPFPFSILDGIRSYISRKKPVSR